MKTNTRIALFAVAFSFIASIAYPVMADCPLAHTHIGKNPTWRPADWGPPPTGAVDPDSTDDDKLWFFSLPPIQPAGTPDWPAWGDDPFAPAGTPFLKLVMETDEFGDPIPKWDESGKYLWTCRFTWSKENGYGDPEGAPHLDGWHSAHGPQGAWNLASVDEATEPDWDIGIRRHGATDNLGADLNDDFFMLLPNDSPVLSADDQTYMLGREWLEDHQAWGIHTHMGFYFWLTEEADQIVSAEFVAFDDGGMYQDSDPFEMRFVTLPEPGTIGFLTVALAILARRRHQMMTARSGV